MSKFLTMGMGELIWFNDNEEEEAKAAYSKRLAEQSVEEIDLKRMVVFEFDERVLAEHGGTILDYDHDIGFHPPGFIVKKHL